MARVTFNSMFLIEPDGSLVPTQTLRIAGTTLTPEARITRGTFFGGVDLHQYVGNDLEIDVDNETPVIIGIYPAPEEHNLPDSS